MSSQSLKIAVIQLTRIGDLIQTTQAVRQFRNENPDITVTLIARRRFAEGLDFLLKTVFDEIILFETKDFFNEKSLDGAKTSSSAFIKDINEREFDVCVNLSFSKSSTFLNSLINCKLRLGMHRNTKGEIAINDKWSQYVFSNVLNTTSNPFNLVDIFRFIMGCQDVHVLSNELNSNKKDIIVLHPFASSKKKMWGQNKWSELIFKLIKDNPKFEIHIVGGKEDQKLAKSITESPALQSNKKNIFDHTEKGSLANTYQLLSKAKLFIGHDSVVSHIAAETLTPSVVVSIGTVRPNETTAYQSNVINVSPRNKCYPCAIATECDTQPCHNSINYQVIASLGKGLINSEKIDYQFITENINPFHLDTVNINVSKYSDFGLELDEVTSNTKNTQEVFKEYYKIIWQCYLRDLDLNSKLPEISRSTASDLYKYQDGINYLYEIFNFGSKFSNKIITELETEKPDYKVVQEHINKLTEIDNLCTITQKSYPLLSGLIDYVYVHKANVQGEDLIDMAKNYLITYYDAANLAAVLSEFVEKSVAPHLAKEQPIKEV